MHQTISQTQQQFWIHLISRIHFIYAVSLGHPWNRFGVGHIISFSEHFHTFSLVIFRIWWFHIRSIQSTSVLYVPNALLTVVHNIQIPPQIFNILRTMHNQVKQKKYVRKIHKVEIFTLHFYCHKSKRRRRHIWGSAMAEG